MSTDGYVRLYRGLIGNPQFRGMADEYAAMWLITKAAWKSTTVRVARQAVQLTRGQCAFAVRFLGEAWECGKSSAHSRLKHLEKVGFIRTETRTGYTLISICNYDKYQSSDDDARTDDRTGPRTEPGQSPDRARTNKKEIKKIKKEEKTPPIGGEKKTAPSFFDPSRGSRLPEDWTLPSKWRDWAIDQGHLRPDQEAQRFADYWHSVPGQRARKADWEATWRNWVRKSLESRTAHRPRAPVGNSIADALAEMSAETERNLKCPTI